MVEFFNNPIVLEIIGGLVGIIYSYLKLKGKINEDWKKVLEESVKVGVVKTYQDYVRGLKKINVGNKLTANQIQEARTKAMNTAVKHAKEQGKNILEKFGPDVINVLIEETVSKMKTK